MKNYYVSAVEQHSSYLVLRLRPRSQNDVIDFLPGQYATIGFTKAGRPSPMRCFSMISSPRNRQELAFAMRVQGNFTQAIARLKVGKRINLQGPFGAFVVNPEYDRSLILLAGGIGITPFMSIVKTATEERSPIPMTLLYACRSQNDIPFYDELLDLQQRNPHFRVVFFVSDGQINKQPGVTMVPGQIGSEQLDQITAGRYGNFTYMLCGPEGFRDSLESHLYNKQIDSFKIVSESFSQTNQLQGAFGWRISSLTYALAGFTLLLASGFIMSLDVARALPKIQTTSTTTSQQPVSQQPASQPTASSSYSTNAAPVNSYTYQAPVTSVS